jgi:RNA polymerase sigma factor (sigma-70 family)
MSVQIAHEENMKSSSYATTQAGVLDEIAAKLVIDHMEMGRRLAWKLLSSWNSRLADDEVVSIVGISLCEAAKNYDGRESTQFQTFLYYHLRGRLLKEISEIVATKKFQSDFVQKDNEFSFVEEKEHSIWNELHGGETNSPEKIAVDKEEQENFEKAFLSLDSLEKEVITRHYFKGESLMNLSEELNYCRCHLSRVKKRAINKLKKEVKETPEYRFSEESSQTGIGNTLGYKGGRGRRKERTPVKVRAALPNKEMRAMVLEAVHA